jgi:hypothetical protein
MTSSPFSPEPLPPDVDAFAAELRSRQLAATDALLVRIQQDRARGVRVLLPTGATDGQPTAPSMLNSASPSSGAPTGASTAPRAWRWGMLAAGVAAVAAIALWRPLAGPSEVGDAPSLAATEVAGGATASAEASPAAPAAASPSPASALAGLMSPWPVLAYAQSPSAPPPAPYPPITQVDVSRLVPGRRSYVRLSGNAYHELLPHQTYDVSVDSIRLSGRRSWRVVVTRPIGRSLTTSAADAQSGDTLWLDGSTLRPRLRRYQSRDLRMRQTFSDTTLAETDSIDSRGRPMPPGAKPRVFGISSSKQLDRSRIFVPSEAALRVLLRALPLGPGWRGSVAVLSGGSRDQPISLGSPTVLNLRVAGTDTVQTFSGRFVCWRVLLETGAEPEVWHVSQETGETILTDGAYDRTTYPQSRSYLVSGLEETRRVPPVRVPR